MPSYRIVDGRLVRTPQPPPGMHRLMDRPELLLPPLITDLHLSFRAWGVAGYSPGPVTPERLWIGADGALAMAGPDMAPPKPLMQIGTAPDLAAWLVLLDRWMETFVVIARARAVWSVEELGAALSFLTPAYLPPTLVQNPAMDWARVAHALAEAVADGPLSGSPSNRHWQGHG